MSLAVSEVNRAIWLTPRQAFTYRNASELFPAETAILQRLAGEIATASVLDLGVGTGRTTRHLTARCSRYTGIDYSPAMIAAARARLPEADLRVMDARDLGAFASEAFDVVLFSFNGIDYGAQEDRLAILGEVRRVLRPGGAFAFSSHNRQASILAAWSPANIRPSANPLRLAGNLAKYALGIVNARRLRPLERHESEYAVINDNASQYRLLTYYIAPSDQRAQLERMGFCDVLAFGLDGAMLSLDSQPVAALASDYMMHYLAWRR